MYIGMIGPGMEPEQTGTSDTKQECKCKWPNVCKDLVSRRTMSC